MVNCWCGSRSLTPFSPLYKRCEACATLVLNYTPKKDVTHVTDDALDLYGKTYYLERLVRQYGFPPLEIRARSELSERCLYWLRALLKYKLPPAAVLELGSSHGGFVAMMRWAGYDATGLELSPWLVEFAKANFGVPMLTGPIEDQDIEANSLDAIILMDVLEHLPDPAGTIGKCLSLLKPDGIMMIQTPCCPDDSSYEQLLSSQSSFLEQLKYEEHLYLFTRRSVQTFFDRLGVGNLNFEPAIFSHYDMFFAVSKSPFAVQTSDSIAAALSAGKESRLIQALLDADDARRSVVYALQQSETDRADRMAIINRQSEELAALRRQIEELSGEISGKKECPAMSTEVIERQPEEPAPLAQQMVELTEQTSKEKKCPAVSTEVIGRRPATIAVDVTPIQPDGANGGVKQLVLELLKGFGEKVRSDKFILLTSYQNDHIFQDFEKYDMKRISVSGTPINKRSSLLKIGKDILTKTLALYERRGILKRNGVSVLFCPFTAPTFIERGIPTVSIICDLQHMYYPSFFGRAEYEHRQRYYAQLKRKVDYFICISEYTRKTAIDKLALPINRVFSIPICVQSRLGMPSRDLAETVLKKYNLDGKTYAIYPSNLWPHKNHKMLMVAFRMFLSRYPGIDLHLVLTGASLEENFEELLAKMRMSDKVHFLHYLDESELSAIWAGSYFLIFPSLFEGFGIPIVEAMMYGKPILASNVTSIPEVAGDAALYFDPRRPDTIVDAMFTVMTSSTTYCDLVDKGKKRLRQFDFSPMVDRYLEVLHLASSNSGVIHHTDVMGIYEDAWAAERIAVTHERSAHDKKLILKGIIPAWHPQARMKIITFQEGLKTRTFVVQRNKSFTVEETLPARGGILDFVVSEGFIPQNGDSRKLTFTVESASIVEGHTGAQLYRFGDAE